MANTDIAFHFNAPGKIDYTCKLLRKATLTGARVAVLAPADLLARLDQELWTFSAVDFVAHLRAPCTPQEQARTGVLLCTDAAQLTGYTVLVNLQSSVPAGFERFERLIEIVSADEADRQAARVRWMHYKTLGFALTRHDIALKT